MSTPPEDPPLSAPRTRRSARVKAGSPPAGNTGHPAATSPSKTGSARTKTRAKANQDAQPSTPTGQGNEGSSKEQRESNPLKRKKTTVVKTVASDNALTKFLKLLNDDDREIWKGWCDLESEPAFFNVILRDLGIEGVKVQEIFGLDEELLAYVPKPVYGLIFLSQFKDDDPTKQEATCPDHIWFANQTTSNACASIALLNIMMNIKGLDLGPILESLKDFTWTLTPALRGYSVCNHDFIRQVHNSFSRKMDMIDTDLALFNDMKSKKSRKKNEEYEELPGFHFVAFVPIDGSVWKLDGLDRQPMNLGDFEEDWMEVARPLIQERMEQFEGDQIRFNLLALCKSPLLTKPEELAVNARSLEALEAHLDAIKPDWRVFESETPESANIVRGPDPNFLLTPGLFESSAPPRSFIEKLSSLKKDTGGLMALRDDLVKTNGILKMEIVDEIRAVDQDKERAVSRRHDYTPAIHAWIRFLADGGALEELLGKAK